LKRSFVKDLEREMNRSLIAQDVSRVPWSINSLRRLILRLVRIVAIRQAAPPTLTDATEDTDVA
jgi:hypothetical protein